MTVPTSPKHLKEGWGGKSLQVIADRRFSRNESRGSFERDWDSQGDKNLSSSMGAPEMINRYRGARLFLENDIVDFLDLFYRLEYGIFNMRN